MPAWAQADFGDVGKPSWAGAWAPHEGVPKIGAQAPAHDGDGQRELFKIGFWALAHDGDSRVDDVFSDLLR
ncbi:hypothetical protein B9Z47_04925 [Limnohabitans sp. 2KL-1]|nr:hypothetical protein B9Z47_04925 [Limnohabitans sp. 2KL-1]